MGSRSPSEADTQERLNLKNAVVHAKSRSPRRKTDGYTKQVNHLFGEVALFNNSLISSRLCVRWIAVFRLKFLIHGGTGAGCAVRTGSQNAKI
jgi:hypothetical protein